MQSRSVKWLSLVELSVTSKPAMWYVVQNMDPQNTQNYTCSDTNQSPKTDLLFHKKDTSK